MGDAINPDELGQQYEPQRRLLLLVAELHRRGFQRLRIAPGMSPSGMNWRCALAPISTFAGDDGARTANWESPLIARYTSADGTLYFGWQDAQGADVKQLADLFQARFPETCSAAAGEDAAYTIWFEDMLERTYPDAFPIAYADWELPSDRLLTVGGRELVLPLPPPPLR